MSSLRNSSSSSNKGTKSSSISSSPKKPSFLVRFIKWTFFQMFVFFTTIILLWVGYAAWTTINPSQWADGQPVTQTLMQGMINNLNDLNTRLQAINPSGTALSASTVQINSVVVGGTACSPDWLVGRNGSWVILSCQSNIWQSNTASTMDNMKIAMGLSAAWPSVIRGYRSTGWQQQFIYYLDGKYGIPWHKVVYTSNGSSVGYDPTDGHFVSEDSGIMMILPSNALTGCTPNTCIK